MIKPLSIHPNASKRLISAFRKCGGIERALARDVGVNVRYIHDILIHGVEPSSPDVRAALFLPRVKRHKKPAWLKEAVDNLKRLQRDKEAKNGK